MSAYLKWAFVEVIYKRLDDGGLLGIYRTSPN